MSRMPVRRRVASLDLPVYLLHYVRPPLLVGKVFRHFLVWAQGTSALGRALPRLAGDVAARLFRLGVGVTVAVAAVGVFAGGVRAYLDPLVRYFDEKRPRQLLGAAAFRVVLRRTVRPQVVDLRVLPPDRARAFRPVGQADPFVRVAKVAPHQPTLLVFHPVVAVVPP